MEVFLSGSLVDSLKGLTSVEVEAKTIRELLTRLIDRYPRLEDHLEEGIAVAINGEIFQDTWFEPIPDGADVHILPAIGGG